MDSNNVVDVKVKQQHSFEWWCDIESLISKPDITQPVAEVFDHSMNTFLGIHCQPFTYSPMELISWQPQQSTEFEFKDFDEFGDGFRAFEDGFHSFCDDTIINMSPLNQVIDHCNWSDSISNGLSENATGLNIKPAGSSSMDEEGKKKCSKKSKSVSIELDEIKRHFNVPITKAAKEMKVGLTALKKRCRELQIKRWPHRKIKSLTSLIDNVKELGLTTEVEKLEEHRRLMEKLPEIELTEKTKRLRQACFKANYKKRRTLAALA